MTYRPEIDGMRALAIIPVVVYHLKIPNGSSYLLPGGFLGVDVFFVISGYLITSLLLNELAQTGNLSIRRFYMRRARRILPALLLVIFASLVAGWLIMLPSELERLAASSIAALAFVSNIFWYFELGTYGAQSGLLQPMLHTWSLGIEEQFYLFFPLLLFMLKPIQRPRVALYLSGSLTLVSLSLSHATFLLAPEVSFFSPVGRAWELMVGVLIAMVMFHRPQVLKVGPKLGWLLPKLALLTLAASMVSIELPNTAHPGLATVPTVAAAAILIVCARPKETVTQCLSLTPLTYIGKLSYSIYLWHFPIFAFGRLLNVGPPDAVTMLMWGLLTLVLSALCYHLVERPLRFTVSDRPCAMTLGASLSVWAAMVLWVATADLNERGRMDQLAQIYDKNEIDNDVLRKGSWQWLDDLAGPEEKISTGHALGPSLHESERLWFASNNHVNLLVLGNSHSKDLFNALFSSKSIQHEFAVARFGIAADFPSEQLERLYASPNFHAADWLVIATRFGNSYKTQLPVLIEEFKKRGKNVALVGNTVEFDWTGPLPIFDWFVQTYGAEANLSDLNALAWEARAQHLLDRNGTLRQIAEDSAVPYLSRADLVCDSSQESCTLATPDGLKTMYDREHWTLEGASYFGARAAERGWLSELKNKQSSLLR